MDECLQPGFEGKKETPENYSLCVTDPRQSALANTAKIPSFLEFTFYLRREQKCEQLVIYQMVTLLVRKMNWKGL